MEILEAYDLVRSFRDAGELAGCSHNTVALYVARRDAGQVGRALVVGAKLIDAFLPQLEAWMEASKGKIRADVAHDRLVALGFTGSERTTRPAVSGVRAAYRRGRLRVHRPWVSEPGLWLQYDFGDGPVVDGAKTVLFCAWLAWSRFRVVLALRDKTLPSVFAALDVVFRALGGAPTYVLTDNEKTVTTEHVAADRGAQRADGRVRRALLGERQDVRAGGPGQQGRHGERGETGQGRHRAHRREPAGRVPVVRGAGGGVRVVLRDGELPGAPHDQTAAGRDCWPRNALGCTGFPRRCSPPRSARPARCLPTPRW